MNRILPIVLALMIMPLALADNYRTWTTPSITGSPAVAQSQATSNMVYRAPPVYTPQPMGVTRDVRFLPPVSEEQLQLDENGVVTNQEGNPVAYGTAGGIVSYGFDTWRTGMTKLAGPYFSTNQQGFRASPVITTHYQKWRGRPYTTDFLGYHEPRQILKQWGSGIAAGKYLKPGITRMIVNEPQYVQPGLPGQPVPQ